MNSLVCLSLIGALSRHAFAQDLEADVLSGRAFTENAAPENPAADLESAREQNAPPPDVDEDKLEAVEEAARGPRQIPYDHILVVQRRFIRKEGRHEFSPLLASVQLVDSYRRQVQWGFAFTHHFSETLAWEAANVGFITNFDTGLSKVTKEQTGVSTDRIEPVITMTTALQWTPLSSKTATSDDIFYFEGYFLLGGGMTKFADKFGATGAVGMGFRAYVTRRLILKAEFRDYLDFRSGVKQRANIGFGASILLGGD